MLIPSTQEPESVFSLIDERWREEAYHIYESSKIKMENKAFGKAAWIIKALIQALVCLREMSSWELH